MASCSFSGETWSRTVFELHRGGLYGSSVVLSNGTIVTAFAWNATAAADGHGGGDSGSLGLLHWEPPSEVKYTDMQAIFD